MSIYPTISLPRLIAPSATRQQKNLKEGLQPSFDFLSGEFLFGEGGRPILINKQNAFEQWVLKVCMTERNTRLAYSDRIGVEFMRLATINDREAIKSSIVRTLTEAIMIHPRAKSVKDFSFTMEADSVWVSFEVRSDYGESRLKVEL